MNKEGNLYLTKVLHAKYQKKSSKYTKEALTALVTR
jgi:hypothetical protein